MKTASSCSCFCSTCALEIGCTRTSPPLHPSDPYDYLIFSHEEDDAASQSSDSFSYQCSHSLTLTPYGSGYRLQGTVSPSDPIWSAAVYAYFPFSYDSKTQGPITQLLLYCGARFFGNEKSFNPNPPPEFDLEEDGPVKLGFGVAVEYDGKKYSSPPSGGEQLSADSPYHEPCGSLVQAGVQDFSIYSRRPYSWERQDVSDYRINTMDTYKGYKREPTQFDVSFNSDPGPGFFQACGRAEDYLNELATGPALQSGFVPPWDTDSRPLLSMQPNAGTVTKAGFWVGLSSMDTIGGPSEYPGYRGYDSGDVEIDMLIEKPCLFASSPGIYKYDFSVTDGGGGALRASDYRSNIGVDPIVGDVVVDEDFSSMPVGWTQTSIFDRNGDPFFNSGAAATFSIDNGSMILDGTFGGERLSSALWRTFTFVPPPYEENFHMILEWEYKQQDISDIEFSIPGRPDPQVFRNNSHGVFIGDWFLVRAYNHPAEKADGNGGRVPLFGQPLSFGDGFSGSVLYKMPDFVGGLERDNKDNIGPWWDDFSLARVEHDTGYMETVPGVPFYFHSPMDGDRYALVVLRATKNLEWADISSDPEPDHWEDLENRFRDQYFIMLFVNGRRVLLLRPNVSGEGGAAPAPFSPDWRIGVTGQYGGRWSNMKLRIRNGS